MRSELVLLCTLVAVFVRCYQIRVYSTCSAGRAAAPFALHPHRSSKQLFYCPTVISFLY